MNSVLNFVLFQAGWFATILLAADDEPILATGAGVAFVVLHLLLVRDRGTELKLLLPSLPFGLVVDSIFASTGAVEYRDAIAPGLCSPWILATWLLFAATVRHSFRWILGKRLVPLVLGAIVAPISYAGGARLGAVEFGEPFARSVVIIGVVWGIAMMLIVMYADRVIAATNQDAAATPPAEPAS
jgi:Protein of unknown function (DUF2878)